MTQLIQTLFHILFPKKSEFFDDEDKALEAVFRYKGETVPNGELEKIGKLLTCLGENSIVPRIERTTEYVHGEPMHIQFTTRYFVQYDRMK